MVWVHWASSELVGVSWRAWLPLWTGLPTTAAVPASQDQGARLPVSKPGLLTRLPLDGGVGVGGGALVGVGVGGACVGVGLGGVVGVGVGGAVVGVGGGLPPPGPIKATSST